MAKIIRGRCMRLIDADLLKKNCKCTGEFEDNFKCVSLTELARVIDNQPTAYDVNRIVEQLEETKGIYSELSLIFRDNTEIKKYIGMEQAIALALEIVKGSGVK